MVMKSITVLIIAMIIPHAWGVFDGRNGGPRPGDRFPITGTLLQCYGQAPGEPLLVGLNVTNPGEVFRPLRSRYRFPIELFRMTQSGSDLLALMNIISQLNITMSRQMINRPGNESDPLPFVAFFPLRYDTTSQDYRDLQAICGADVISNVTDNFTRNADQPTFWDITQMLRDDWLQIWDGFTPAEQTSLNYTRFDPDVTRGGWTDEQIPRFMNMLQLLSCRVAFKWQDAGPTYLPRYFVGGFCRHKNCSMPDRDEFRCHADLSPEETGRLEAARWDCCWTFNNNRFQYECGFRKVQFPIVCDCDCRCADKAGTK